MNRLLFDDQPAIATSAPARTDIACFIGFLRPRPDMALPASLSRWFDERGWVSGPYARAIEALHDVPVPIETWDVFDRLFEWDHRASNGEEQELVTDLGAAVRSFFAQGGRTCYVVSVGDPEPLAASRADRLVLLDRMLPGSSFHDSTLAPRIECSPSDRPGWRGIGHLFGLPDVSFVCLPDLPAMVASDPVPLDMPPPPPIQEQFVECSEGSVPPSDTGLARFTAPRCDRAAYADWAAIIEAVVQRLLARHLREMQLIAGLPLPQPGLTVDADLVMAARNVVSPFLQLGFPWCRTSTARRLPGGVENPEGALAGILASNALQRGTFRSAAARPVVDVFALVPELSQEARVSPSTEPARAG